MITLQSQLTYQFKNISILETALTHKSFSNASKPLQIDHNEKLEFLGDAVLQLTMSEILFSQFPMDQEGELSKKRASLVNEEILSKVAVYLGVQDWLRLGKGEIRSQVFLNSRVLASAVEAILGAIFLEAGYKEVKRVVEVLLLPYVHILASDISNKNDFKTRLQEKVQEKLKTVPVYQLVQESGPEHDKSFQVSVKIEDLIFEGIGKSKKQAEQKAAEKALEDFK